MNAEGELLRAYREWHRLAQAETKAIQTRNWGLFHDCHRAIQNFQTQIAALAADVRTGWRRAGDAEKKERHLQALIADLMDLTRHNEGLLQTTLDNARHRLDQLGETGKNLKQLRRSYGVTPAWNPAN